MEGCPHECVSTETSVKCEGPADEYRKNLPGRREGKCARAPRQE